MNSTMLPYFKERFAPTVFAPVILLLALAACWSGNALNFPAFLRAAGLITLLVVQFRLWDDLADRDRDRVTQPQRVLVRAERSDLFWFRILLGALALIGLGTVWSLGGTRSLVVLAALDATFAILYALVRPHLSEGVWRFPVLLAKYPAFVAIVASSVGVPSAERIVVAMLFAYAAALAYEALHAGGVNTARDYTEKPPTAEMFETVRCYTCASERSTFHLHGEDDLTGRPGRFTYVRCADCGLVYQSPRLALEHIKSYYADNYIAHQERRRWGALAPAVAWAMGAIDRAKLKIVSRYVTLGTNTAVLDVGCGAGTFLANVRGVSGAKATGVDFVDLSAREAMRGVEFHHGLFYNQPVNQGRFDLVTMWHFLEHDYDPMRSLKHAAEALAPDGLLIIEVPRLDSLSARLFGTRWPGVQAPQHTALYDKPALENLVRRADLEIVDYLPYGAFPPYFYLFCGVVFRWRRGRGLDLSRAVAPYFAGQITLLPILPLLKYLNFAMQTVVCRRRSP